MKKVLLATSVLAFAGSVSAATVAGSVTTKYEKSGEVTAFKTNGAVTFSGSKTSSNGLTFGGSYVVKVGNAKSTADALSYTASSLTYVSTSVMSPAGTKVAAEYEKASLTQGKASLTEGTQTVSEINAFVSGSFGKVDMGLHNNAGVTAGLGGGKVTDAITYTSPSLSGFSGAYTYAAGKYGVRAWNLKYAGEMSGVAFTAAYGTYKVGHATDAKKRHQNKGFKVSATMSGVTVAGNRFTDKDAKRSTGWSVKYAAPSAKWDVSYAQDKNGGNNQVTKTMKANYVVAEGLKIIVENKNVANNNTDKTKNKRTTFIGTTISF